MSWNEASLKKKIHKDLSKIKGIWKYSPCQMGFGSSGIPDIVACVPTLIKESDVGKTFGLLTGIEAKIGKNKPTKLQMAQLKGIAAAGGSALVITGQKGEPYIIERIK